MITTLNFNKVRLFAKAGECTDKSLIRKVDVFNEEYRLKGKRCGT